MDAQELRLLLRPEEVSGLTGYSRATIYRMIADGTLPAIKGKFSVRVPKDALMRWIAQNTRGGDGVQAA